MKAKRWFQLMLVLALTTGLVPVQPVEAQGGNRFTGVTLPILGYPGGGVTREFIQHPTFSDNLRGMGWNTIRLQIVWSFLDSEEKVVDATRLLGELVTVLRERVYQGQRIYLILDFHHFRFGPDCGGHGIPAGRIAPPTSIPSDNNCSFLAFEKLWQSEPLRADWVRFAMRFVAVLPDIAEANKDWLTLGIEPMNEPIAGSTVRLFDGNSVQQALKVWAYVTDVQSSQIERRLIPFYQQFMKGVVSTVPREKLPAFLSQTFFVMDPFLFDHISFTIKIGRGITLGSNGNYSRVAALKSLQLEDGTTLRVNWLASPHHYVGAYDTSTPPSNFGALAKYVLYSSTNPFINREQMEARFKMWNERFLNQAGMHFFIGEYGTFTRLPAYKAWIGDTNEFAAKYALGALWYQYRQDLFTDDQASYNLLRRFDDRREAYPPEVQRLKCGVAFGELVETVFGRCFDALEFAK